MKLLGEHPRNLAAWVMLVLSSLDSRMLKAIVFDVFISAPFGDDQAEAWPPP
tara:strand:+ start:358 stop:513 length:156 start_codon:yes stop_codon:yes gene_type:complete